MKELRAALRAIEDGEVMDLFEALDASVRLEEQARALGAEPLVQRARLCHITMRMRAGELNAAARDIWSVHRWAEEHREPQLLSRVHMVWSNIHQLLGDSARCLEHAVTAVELLDDSSTPYMLIWHRLKLADALAMMGSMDDARARYAQTEELCDRWGRPDLLLWVRNNHAYVEYAAGDVARAEQVAVRLREAASEQGVELQSTMLDTIGLIEIANGRFAEAEQVLLRCIARYDGGRLEDADTLAEYLLTLAQARRGLGAYDRAQASLDESRAICVERDLGQALVLVHQEQAELHAARGDHAAAFATHKLFHAAHVNRYTADHEAQARTRHVLFETVEARQEAARFRELARRDPLTGLHNRRYVDERLPVLIDDDPRLSVAIVDLDHFKRINDTLSHDVGDLVLVRVAKLLEARISAARPDGFAARLGGEEFLLVLPDTPVPEAARVLDRIRHEVRTHGWDEITVGLPVTVSIGLAGIGDAPTRNQPGLLSAADRNLYAAKRGGRDRVVSDIVQAELPEANGAR